MARERATEAGVGARVALRTIESTHVSPTSTCPHTQRRSHMCAPTRGGGRTGNLTVLVMGAAVQAGSGDPDRWVEIFCSLVAILEDYSHHAQTLRTANGGPGKKRLQKNEGRTAKKEKWHGPSQ